MRSSTRYPNYMPGELNDTPQPPRRSQRNQQASELAELGAMAPLYAHEINNLITQLSGRAQLALMQIKNEAVVEQSLQSIIDGCQRAASLSELFLSTGTTPSPNDEPASLSLIVDAVRSSIPECEFAQDLLILDMADSDPAPAIPPIVLQQVLDNLIRNALRGIDEHPDHQRTSHEIRITCETDHHCSTWNTPGTPMMRIVVTDTGVGMTSDQIRSIFARNEDHRSAGPHNARYPRHGLGMRVCRMLIESVGGSISYESKPNQGTRVTLMVPIHDQGSGTYRSAA